MDRRIKNITLLVSIIFEIFQSFPNSHKNQFLPRSVLSSSDSRRRFITSSFPPKRITQTLTRGKFFQNSIPLPPFNDTNQYWIYLFLLKKKKTPRISETLRREIKFTYASTFPYSRGGGESEKRRRPWMKCRDRTVNKLFYSPTISLFSHIWG